MSCDLSLPKGNKKLRAVEIIGFSLHLIESNGSSAKGSTSYKKDSPSTETMSTFDQLTTGSDGSSLSSSCQRKLSPSSRRSLFNGYWENKIGSSSSSSETASAISVPRVPFPQKRAVSTVSASFRAEPYDIAHKVNEEFRQVVSYSRSSFFGNNKSGWQPQSFLQSLRDFFSRIRSSSAPQKSCLRQGRFSGGQEMEKTEAPPDASVSFCGNVDVLVYQRPAYSWETCEWSWSRLFA